jgi:hypothetical protein
MVPSDQTLRISEVTTKTLPPFIGNIVRQMRFEVTTPAEGPSQLTSGFTDVPFELEWSHPSKTNSYLSKDWRPRRGNES